METHTLATPPTKRPGGPLGPLPFLINRNFALLWLGQLISYTGDYVFETALVLWVATSIARGQQWAPMAVGGTFLAVTIPWLIIAPIAGVFVDRWHDKRRTMLWTNGLSLLLIAVLILATGVVPLPFIGSIQPPVILELAIIYGTSLLLAACAQFFSPAHLALIGDVVDAPDRTRASGSHQVTIHLGTLLGPVVGSLLFFSIGVQWTLLLNLLSFLVAFIAILAVRPPARVQDIPSSGNAPPEQRATFLHEFIMGLRFYRDSRALMTLLVTGTLIELGSGVRSLGIFFLTGNLHAPGSLYGLLNSGFGIGLLAGAGLAVLLGPRLKATHMYGTAVLAMGVFAIVYARMTNFAPGLALLFLGGLAQGVFNAAEIAILLHVTPRDFVGRALAVLTPAYGLAGMLSTGSASYLYSTLLHDFHATLLGISFSALDTLFIAMSIPTLIGGMYALISLRGIHIATRDAK